jgi:hypothetical protein
MTTPNIDLRTGIRDPVVLLISRRQVEEGDVASVLKELRILTATREDTWLYRNQMTLVLEGYDEDPRALVDIPEARHFLTEFSVAWPYWAFFFNHVDDSLIILGSCVVGSAYPGHGVVEVDKEKLRAFLNAGFAGIDALFEKHMFDEGEKESLYRGFLEVFENASFPL